jgi:predicted PurR-regulated permease PerM
MNKKKDSWFSKRTLSNIIIICSGILLYLALSNLGEVGRVAGNLWSVFSPFLGGVIIAYLLNMPMRYFERRLFKNRPPKSRRVLAILATYLSAVLVLALLISLITPQIAESMRTLVANANLYLNNLNALVTNLGAYFHIDDEVIDTFLLSYENLVKAVLAFFKNPEGMASVLDAAGQIGSGIVGVLVALFTSVITSVYILAGRDKLILQCRRLMYAVAPRRFAHAVTRVGRLSNRIFSGFISGKMLDSAIIGGICFVGLSIMNIISSIFKINGLYIQFSVLISVVVGVTNIIPFFGPFIGAIPCVLILLMVSPWSAVWFAVFVVVLQQLDGNFIGPKILGNSTGLPAMWVLVALIVGGGLFGVMGMLLGVPTTAVLYSMGSDFIENRLRKRKLAQHESLRRFGASGAGKPDSAGQSALPNPPSENDAADGE